MKCGKRILCIWLRRWPLERLALARAELKGRAVLLYEVQARGGALKVSAYTPALAVPPVNQRPGDQRSVNQRPGGQRQEARQRRSESAAAGAPRSRIGIQPGMPLAEALALHELAQLRQPHAPQELALHLEAHDPWADRLALAQLAAACQQFSPIVGLEDAPRPDCLLLDITGPAPRLGGEPALLAAAAELLAERGLTARLAVADTVGAAWALAHAAARDAPAALAPPGGRCWIAPPGAAATHVAPLPIAALRLPPETVALLTELGIRRIEQIGRLPRSTLLCRFGAQLVRRLDEACGLAEEVILAEHEAGELEAQWPLEYATGRRDAIEAILARLLPQVVEPLASQRKGVLKLDCRLDCQQGDPWRLSLGLFRASASVDHLLDMLRLRLESVRLRQGVTAVRLTVALSGLLDLEQRQLFAPPAARGAAREVAALVDRLTSRLGRQAVLRPQLLADAQPEHACQYLPLWHQTLRHQTLGHKTLPRHQKTHRPKAGREKTNRPAPGDSLPAEAAVFAPGERPLRLHVPPAELTVLAVAPDGPPLRFRWLGAQQQVRDFWGPERIETGWWRTRCVRRDYYRVETTGGQRFWLFRRLADGRWFLHGTFE